MEMEVVSGKSGTVARLLIYDYVKTKLIELANKLRGGGTVFYRWGTTRPCLGLL